MFLRKMYDLRKVSDYLIIYYLFSSNEVAFFFSRLRIHIARDRPDNRVPPVATPETMAVNWDGEAVETLSNVNHKTF